MSARRAGRHRIRGAMVLALVLALLAACESSTEAKEQPLRFPESAAFEGACAGTLSRRTRGAIESAEMNESSGLVMSALQPDTLWVNNDSGDSARLFAISPTGALRGIVSLAGATAIDWEDIAAGPGPEWDTPYLYVGDIGDNSEARSEVVVYRVAEPVVAGDGGTSTLSDVAVLTLQYPDGPHDAEALMVDPRSGQLFIIVKQFDGGPAGVYRAPAGLAAGTTTVLERIGQVELPRGLPSAVTAADISRDGSTIAVRTYGAVRLWNRGGTTVIAALGSAPCRGPIPLETQGEAIGIAPDGRSYFTVSEGVKVPVHQFAARPSAPG